MLGLSPPLTMGQVRIYLYTKDVDMRKSFDGLHAIVQSEFQRDVRDGDVFLFLNRRLDRLKLLYWDRDGLAIWMKKLESDYPRFFLFTEFGRDANNLSRQPAAAG